MSTSDSSTTKPVSAIHRPSTKRHIMPQTHECHPATTPPPYTLNEHTTTKCLLGTHCTYNISLQSALYRTNTFSGSGLQKYFHERRIYGITAKQSFMMINGYFFFLFHEEFTAKALHFRLSGIFWETGICRVPSWDR